MRRLRVMAPALRGGLAPGLPPALGRGPAATTPDVSDLNEDGQLRQLPRLPQGMTLDMIRQGDALFRGRQAV
jgi:hypothetical protein